MTSELTERKNKLLSELNDNQKTLNVLLHQKDESSKFRKYKKKEMKKLKKN